MRKTDIHPALAAVLAAFLVAGCGSANDANEKNFAKAISGSLEKARPLCLGLDEWPKDFDEGKFPSLHRDAIRRMEVLKAAGLVTSQEFDSEPRNHYGKLKTFKVTRYTLTDEGNKYKKSITSSERTYEDVCYGKKSLAKIVKWVAPSEFAGITHTKVTYLYKIDGLPAWATSRDFKEAFPNASRIIDGVQKTEESRGAVLMNTGWESQ